MSNVNTYTSSKAFYGQLYNLSTVDTKTLQTMNLYVNSVTGVDGGPGRGTSPSFPYKNIEVALKKAFALSIKFQVIINLAGALPHGLDDGYVLPMTSSADQVTTAPVPSFGLTQQAPLVIRATPIVLATLVSGAIVSQTNNVISGLKEITTTGGFVPGIYDGKWIRDASGTLARILNNTTTVINICYAGPDLVAPLVVQGAGAVLTPAVIGSSNPTVVMRGGSAPIILFGVDVVATTGPGGGAVQVGPNQQAIFVACDIPSMELGCGHATEICGDAAIEAIACKLGSMAAPQAEVNLQKCLMTGGSFTDVSQKTSVFATACAFTGMLSPLFFDGVNGVGLFQGTNLLVTGGVGNNIQMSGGKLELTTCDVSLAGDNGIWLADGCIARLFGVDTSPFGDNSTTGLVCIVSSRASIEATAVRGASGDLAVGSLPVQSWGDFHLGFVPFTRSSAADNAAVYESTLGTSQDLVTITSSTPVFLNPDFKVVLVDALLAAKTVLLPPLASCFGRSYTIKKIDASIFVVTIDGFGGETIDGLPTRPLSVQYETMTVIAGFTEWSII